MKFVCFEYKHFELYIELAQEERTTLEETSVAYSAGPTDPYRSAYVSRIVAARGS